MLQAEERMQVEVLGELAEEVEELGAPVGELAVQTKTATRSPGRQESIAPSLVSKPSYWHSRHMLSVDWHQLGLSAHSEERDSKIVP